MSITNNFISNSVNDTTWEEDAFIGPKDDYIMVITTRRLDNFFSQPDFSTESPELYDYFKGVYKEAHNAEGQQTHAKVEIKARKFFEVALLNCMKSRKFGLFRTIKEYKENIAKLQPPIKSTIPYILN